MIIFIITATAAVQGLAEPHVCQSTNKAYSPRNMPCFLYFMAAVRPAPPALQGRKALAEHLFRKVAVVHLLFNVPVELILV